MIEARIHEPGPLPDPQTLARLRKLASALVSDVQGRSGAAVGLTPQAALAPGQVVVGPAFTVRAWPGDNLVVHQALDLVRPGEVLVVSSGGAVDRAVIGGLMGHYATTKEVAALVVDGAVRDRSSLEELAPPVFARALCHLGPSKVGPGELRGPVSMGGVAVNDGDIIVADEDGVAVIPRGDLDVVTAAAEAKAEEEEAAMAAIAAGTWDRSWIGQSLRLIGRVESTR